MSPSSGLFLYAPFWSDALQQIRPEKDHAAQLNAFRRLLTAYPRHKEENVKLVLLGGSRNAGDATRVEGLRRLTKELDIEVCLLWFSRTVAYSVRANET